MGRGRVPRHHSGPLTCGTGIGGGAQDAGRDTGDSVRRGGTPFPVVPPHVGGQIAPDPRTVRF